MNKSVLATILGVSALGLLGKKGQFNFDEANSLKCAQKLDEWIEKSDLKKYFYIAAHQTDNKFRDSIFNNGFKYKSNLQHTSNLTNSAVSSVEFFKNSRHGYATAILFILIPKSLGSWQVAGDYGPIDQWMNSSNPSKGEHNVLPPYLGFAWISLMDGKCYINKKSPEKISKLIRNPKTNIYDI